MHVEPLPAKKHKTIIQIMFSCLQILATQMGFVCGFGY